MQATVDEYCPATSAEWTTAEQASAAASTHQTYTDIYLYHKQIKHVGTRSPA